MLQSRIKPLLPTSTSSNNEADDDAEDVFTAFLPHLFPDEAHSCLGDPGQTTLYASPLYGDLRVVVPGYPAQNTTPMSSNSARRTSNAAEIQSSVELNNDSSGGSVEEGRKLFAHYLWGGAIVVADGIEEADKLERDKNAALIEDSRIGRRKRWNVRSQRVLELGAGAALPSLVAALAGADSIAITDHPSSSALSDPIQTTISSNIRPEHIRQQISVHPHEWGTLPPTQDAGRSEQLTCSPAIQFAAENKGQFARIICADCLWMKDQHENLVRSILWFLAPPWGEVHQNKKRGEVEGSGSEDGGVAWVVAGFHTGRGIVASFFETAVAMGLIVEDIWERDMNASSEIGEVTREWRPSRPTEGPENRVRWCVVAFLRKAGQFA